MIVYICQYLLSNTDDYQAFKEEIAEFLSRKLSSQRERPTDTDICSSPMMWLDLSHLPTTELVCVSVCVCQWVCVCVCVWCSVMSDSLQTHRL